ncbi:MAG TPA: hypothetical protein VEC35_01150 [Noviherbaspirillum sp.]|nr:hypothetical protein [Noviherbaspirillum sp.]
MLLSRNEFKAAVDAVTPFSPTRTTMPILTHVKVESTGERVIFTASNTDSQIQYWIDCAGEKFAACIDASALKKFAQFCDGEVSFTVKSKKAVLEFGDTKTRLNTLEADQFPELHMAEKVITEIEWAPLADKIAFATQFCGVNAQVPAAQCVQIKSTGTQIEVFATDTKSMGASIVNHIAPEFGICIPRDTACRMVGNFKSMVVREEQVELRGANSIALFKLAVAKPLQVSKFWQRTYTNKGTISRKSLLDAINFTSSFASSAAKIRPQIVISAGEQCSVKLTGSTDNEATAPFKYQGDSVTFGAYPDDFGSFLKSVEADEIGIEFDQADLKTTAIRLTGGDRIICTMPVRI